MISNLSDMNTCLQGRGNWSILFGLLCWKIWEARNLLIFQQQRVDVASLISQVKALTEFTKEAADTFQQTQGRNRH